MDWTTACRAGLNGLAGWAIRDNKAGTAGIALCLGLSLGVAQAQAPAQAPAKAAPGAVAAVPAAPDAAATPAAGSRLADIPAETFFRHPDLGEAKLSPSGRHLAVTLQVRDRLALAVLDLDGRNPPRVLVRDDKVDIDTFDWVNDQHLVFSIVQLDVGSGDQDFGPGLFSVGLDGGNPRMLVRPRSAFVANVTTLGVEPLHPRHRLLAVPAGGQGDEVVIGLRRFDRLGDLESVAPLRLNVLTGRTRSLAVGMPDKARYWLFDPQGEPRVATERHQGMVTVHWRAPGSSSWHVLSRHPTRKPPFVPHSVDSAGKLFVRVQEPDGAGIEVLKRFDFKTGRPEEQAMARAPGFDFSGSLVHDGASTERHAEGALGLRVLTDAESTVWFKPRMAKLQQVVDQRLPGRTNHISCWRCEADDALLLVQSWSDQDPGQTWIHKPAGDVWQRIGPEREDVDPRRMATLDLHRMRARDGLEIPVWITLPQPSAGQASPPAPRPAVVLVHGGPWSRGVQWQWSDEAQFLASRGYVVIEPEFRGSTGYGSRLFTAGMRQWGLAMQDDVADAVRWATAKGWVDAKRVCIAGASYGGYATLMGLVRDADLYRCGIAWAAVSDPRLMFKWSGNNDLSEESQRYDLPELIGDPVADAALLADSAPLTHAARIRTPLLLAHGLQDWRVPVQHATQLRDAMAAAGHAPEWVLYPDEGHGWLRPANRFDFARRMERFLAQHLK